MAVTQVDGRRTDFTPQVSIIPSSSSSLSSSSSSSLPPSHSCFFIIGWVVLQYMNLALHQINDLLVRCRLHNYSSNPIIIPIHHKHNATTSTSIEMYPTR
jgi:hypothetical protein